MSLAWLVFGGVLAFLAWVAFRESPRKDTRLREADEPDAASSVWRAEVTTTARRPELVNRQPVRPTLAGAAKVPDRPVDELSFDMVYRDADGELTARRIDVESVLRNFDTNYVDAWCHLRRAQRTFRLERILEISSALTGEVLYPPGSALLKFLREASDPGPDFKSVISKGRRGLLCLIWLARTDYDVSEAETEVMLSYLVERAQLGVKGNPLDDWKKSAARQWIDSQRPTLEDALGAIALMSHRGQEKAMCAAYAKQIVDIQPPELVQKVQARVVKLGL